MHRALVCAFALAACGPGPDAADAPASPGADPDPGVPNTDTDPWWAQPPVDLDDDGVTAADGDCDDGDPTVSPAVVADRCDGRDSDCDGQVDEDFDGDPYEQPGPSSLGILDDQDERIVVAYAFPQGDTDSFRFYVPDPSFGFFSVEAWTYGAAPDLDLSLTLRWVEDPAGVDRGVVARVDRVGAGGVEVLDHGGVIGQDDAGWYELTVAAEAGADCTTPYTVQVLVGGL